VKVKDILTESILDEASIGDIARRKQAQRKPVSMGDVLRKTASRVISLAMEHGRSYEDTLPKYINRCKVLKKRDDRVDLQTCKELFDGMWRAIAKRDAPQDKQEFPNIHSVPGATRT